jgi:hypothetical protein
MSRASCAGSLPDNIQFAQTDSSTRNNHLNEFANPTLTTIDKNIIQIKQDQQSPMKKSSKISSFFCCLKKE